MNRAMLVTRLDPCRPDPRQLRRLVQMAAFYRAAGLAPDVLYLCRPNRRGRGFDAALPEAGQTGLLHSDDVDTPEPLTADIHRMVAEMAGPGASYRLVHLDRFAVHGREDLAPFWVVDCDEQPLSAPHGTPPFDLVLAATEPVRAGHGGLGRTALRLPPAVPGRARDLGTRMVGWVGTWTEGLASGWSQILDAMAARGQRAERGILLAGPGADRVVVPPVLAPLVVCTPNPRPGAGLALGLALLPSDDPAGAVTDAAHQVARGCPVILAPAGASVFEDRWHLPTAEGHWAQADAIAAWCADETAADLARATAYTAQALRYDLQAMTVHVSGALPRRIAAVV